MDWPAINPRKLEIVRLHDEEGMFFEDIGEKFGIGHTRAHFLYQETKATLKRRASHEAIVEMFKKGVGKCE